MQGKEKSVEQMSTGRRALLGAAIVIGLITGILFFSSQSAVTACGNAFVAATSPAACNQDNAVHTITEVIFGLSLFTVAYILVSRFKKGA